MKLRLVTAVVTILGSALAAGFLLLSPGTSQSRLNPDDRRLVAQGSQIYQTECAVCHGAQLEGQTNWRERNTYGRLPAPPHDQSGHTWHHPDAQLFAMTKYGIAALAGAGYQSDMPAYETVLSDEEILAVLSYIKSTWPVEIQARHDEINRRFEAAED